MSTGKDTGKKPPEPSKAAKAKDTPTRVDELLKQFEGDRKKAAIT
ncbi:unnamed protein product, partial [marine sediment metagenome]